MSATYGREPELLVDLAAKGTHLAKTLLHMPDAAAEAFGAELAHQMARDWGGESIYFPQGITYKVSKFHQEVWDAFNGSNHNELVRRFHISKVWVYKIIERMRAADQAKRQGGLFSDDDKGDLCV